MAKQKVTQAAVMAAWQYAQTIKNEYHYKSFVAERVHDPLCVSATPCPCPCPLCVPERPDDLHSHYCCLCVACIEYARSLSYVECACGRAKRIEDLVHIEKCWKAG